MRDLWAPIYIRLDGATEASPVAHVNRAGKGWLMCLYESALDVCDAFEDGTYWEEFHGSDENERFWEGYANKHAPGDGGGSGDAAGTGGSGE